MEQAIKAIERIIKNLPKTPAKEPVYKCHYCLDRGYLVTNDGRAEMCPECLKKAERKRWAKQSGITERDYQRYTLESFKADTREAKAMFAAATKFLADENATGLGVFGKSGAGKTHLCVGVCQALNAEHYYWQYRQEIQHLKGVMLNRYDEYEKLLKVPKERPNLYIDDLFKGAFKVGEIQQQDLQIMFDIIDARYRRRLPTIISSEYSLNDITKADEAIGTRIYDLCYPYMVKVTTGNRRLVRNEGAKKL